MNNPKIGIGQDEEKINCSSFSEAFQIKAVKHEPLEVDIFTEYKSSISETDNYLNYQEQNEIEPDAKNSNLKDLGYSKFSENSSNTCTTVQMKIEDGIDIFYKDIKSEADEEKSSKGYRFCEVCYQSIGRETDSFNSTSYRFKCICQNESLFYNFCGESTTHDVKPSLGLTTDSETLPLEVQNGAISGGEVIKQPDSPAVPQRLSVSPMENDNEKSKSCSKLLGNIFPVQYQMNDLVEKKIQCKICLKPFSQTISSKGHEMGHTGKKPFHCEICPKSFCIMTTLKLHKKSQTATKPFRCKVCSKAFTHSDALRVHVKIHSGEKPYHCQICSKSFSRTDHLKVHERSHTGEKPFPCICLKSFSQTGHLKVEKPCHCKIYSKSFTRMHNLNVHQRSHTGEK